VGFKLVGNKLLTATPLPISRHLPVEIHILTKSPLQFSSYHSMSSYHFFLKIIMSRKGCGEEQETCILTRKQAALEGISTNTNPTGPTAGRSSFNGS